MQTKHCIWFKWSCLISKNIHLHSCDLVILSAQIICKFSLCRNSNLKFLQACDVMDVLNSASTIRYLQEYFSLQFLDKGAALVVWNKQNISDGFSEQQMRRKQKVVGKKQQKKHLQHIYPALSSEGENSSHIRRPDALAALCYTYCTHILRWSPLWVQVTGFHTSPLVNSVSLN